MNQLSDAVEPDIRERPFPGPVNQKGPPLDLVDIDGSPEPAVIAFVTIVAHDKKRVFRNNKRSEIIAGAVCVPPLQDLMIAVHAVGIFVVRAVYEYLFVYYFYRVSRDSDYAFYKVFAFVNRVLENDNIALLRLVVLKKFFVGKGYGYAVYELVDHYVVADKKRRLHGSRRDFECLYDECSYEQGKNKSNNDSFDVFAAQERF